MRHGTVCLSCLWSKVRSGQKRWWCNWLCVCIEKSLFALSSFQVCPLSQVKYLSSISEYKSSVWESCEGYRRSAPLLMEFVVSLKSKDNMCVYEGRCTVSSSTDHSRCWLEGFRRERELWAGRIKAGRSGWRIWTIWVGGGGAGARLGRNTEEAGESDWQQDLGASGVTGRITSLWKIDLLVECSGWIRKRS